MTGTWTTRKLAVVSAAVTLIGAAVLLSLALAYPKPISSAELGAEWQCTRTLVWTSCSRIRDTTAVVQSVRKDAPPCPRRRGLNG